MVLDSGGAMREVAEEGEGPCCFEVFVDGSCCCGGRRRRITAGEMSNTLSSRGAEE